MAFEALCRTIGSDAWQRPRDSLAVIRAYSQFQWVNDFQMPQDIEVARRLRDAPPRQGILADIGRSYNVSGCMISRLAAP